MNSAVSVLQRGVLWVGAPPHPPLYRAMYHKDINRYLCAFKLIFRTQQFEIKHPAGGGKN